METPAPCPMSGRGRTGRSQCWPRWTVPSWCLRRSTSRTTACTSARSTTASARAMGSTRCRSKEPT
ncbi:hypothetical protein CRUP_017219 [Coryphaenoides rupestris]|nr:hypothetical protein CRUP_017219 [Coryphaenoides rupestris]